MFIASMKFKKQSWSLLKIYLAINIATMYTLLIQKFFKNFLLKKFCQIKRFIYKPILAIGIPVCMISTTACTADLTSENDETMKKKVSG